MHHTSVCRGTVTRRQQLRYAPTPCRPAGTLSKVMYPMSFAHRVDRPRRQSGNSPFCKHDKQPH
ncbi:hypothetical protein BD779DRAFT_1531143 [Infundibulicybe gibba]|nr:hypothetical protein BD779DRAFT_1531143 [Infundibulicybe gibba]